ncbi:aminotransferase class V [Microtetraspora sp. NBRC 13810]|uniref:aminotransferase class V-fold PLP-dependent enzyme n=1 Tax=Microtetraspora sp. NBRC 13810 TaxID=3030990 RepID=UPI0024A2922A|nr:aminotransferase class V-fold PLP-dependent enzyme [Microtetraspora sp. NBRC 13810]GLW06195.1 aminotransferase class V [Microtetraspora sp. NBRC 13810]
MNAATTAEEFRALFPALRSTVWLDTPGAPPGADPVVEALRDALSAWSGGDFSWQAWDDASAQARVLFARLVGAEPGTVSTMGSLAEAAATVAASIPPGRRVVVAAEEFRSNLFPWLDRHQVTAVPPRDGVTRVEDLVDALDEGTELLAVSEVTSREGRRLDLAALREATDRVGARLFVNLTQSLGVLRFDAAAVRPDYLAVHGYKWLLCPRGAAWLVTRADRLAGLRPLAPGWKSTSPPHGYFGGPMRLAADAGRADASPAWLSWIGARAALGLIGSLDPARVERHCLDLAGSLVEQAAALGFRRTSRGALSHIAVLHAADADRLAGRLLRHGIRATALGDRVRFGFHYFNDETDVLAVLRALRADG